MSMVVEAVARIWGEDKTGSAFDAIAKKLDALSKSARKSIEVGRLGQQFQKFEAAAVSANKLREAMEKLGAVRTNFRAAQAQMTGVAKSLDDARRAAAAFAGVKGSAKGSGIERQAFEARKRVTELVDAYNTAQRTVQRASAVYEKYADAAKVARKEVEAHGLSVKKLGKEQVTLRTNMDQTSAAMLKQAKQDAHWADVKDLTRRKRADAAAAVQAQALAASRAAEARDHQIDRLGVKHAVAAGLTGYVGVHGVGHGIQHTLREGADYQHEIVALKNAGRTPEEMREIEHASHEATKLVPTATFAENLKVINETTGAFGDLHHAIENLPFMQKSSAVLKASAGEKIHDDAGELGNKLARFFEMRGTAGNTPVFQREAAEMVRAMVFTRGNFNPSEMVNFAQQAKASLPLYNERFMSKIVPSLVTEFGGDRAGTAANAFRGVIMGKANDKKQAEEWVNLGLLDKKQTLMKGGHAVSWKAGAVKDTNLALSDPLAWAETILLPALQKRGVKTDDKLELSKALGTMFRNSNSNLFAEALTQNLSRTRLHKDEANINKAGDLDAIYQRNQTEDAKAATAALKSSLENLQQAASGPAMETAARGINMLAGAITSVSLAAKDHPNLAMAGGAVAAGGALAGTGWLSYQLLNGFGLGKSAVALDSSAAALTAAAARLGAGGVAGAAGAAAGAAPAAAGIGLVGGAVAAGVAAGAAVAAVSTADQLPKMLEREGPTGVDPSTGGAMDVNPMGGLLPGGDEEHPLRKLWRENAPKWAGGGGADPKGWTDARGNAGERGGLGRGAPILVPPQAAPVPIPPPRPAELGNPALTKQLEATVKPDQITAKVTNPVPVHITVDQRDVVVRATVAVDGPGRVVDQFVGSTGGAARASAAGRSMPGATQTNPRPPGGA